MKQFQSAIKKYLHNHQQHKKGIAVALTLSIIVSMAVPFSLIMPAISMTGSDGEENIPAAHAAGEVVLKNANGADGNVIAVNGVDTSFSPEEMSLITLIVGEGSGVAWADGCTDIDEVMDAAMNEYFLGIANDFCAFIEGDFTATEADAEGRMFIGGDLSFTGGWNYQAGSGDYATMTHLTQTDNYKDIANFASVIVGGKMYRINTLSTGYGHDRNGKDDWDLGVRDSKDEGYHRVNGNDKNAYTVYYTPEEGLFKRFIVGNLKDSMHKDDTTGEDVPYTVSHSHDYPGLCGESCPHTYLNEINELAQMYEYDGIPNIVNKSFDQIRSRSFKLSQKKGIGVNENGHFTGPGTDSNANTVYFTLDSWDERNWIEFNDIPEGANIVINVGGTSANISGNVTTKINGNQISVGHGSNNERDNNHKDSQRILYNFYEATDVTINGNFNGTILAPNADVHSQEDKCPGHLSGALIAKSFKGALEFGYRPYRGGSDILGLVSGYSVPVDKLISDTDTNLEGASFELIDASTNEAVASWLSIDSTKFLNIPTAVDFSGDTDYTPVTTTTTTETTTTTTTTTAEITEASEETSVEESTETSAVPEEQTEATEPETEATEPETEATEPEPEPENPVITNTYTIKEIAPPSGFMKPAGDEVIYTINVSEEINLDKLVYDDDGGTLPGEVMTHFEILDNKGNKVGEWNINLTDTFGSKSVEKRDIIITKPDGTQSGHLRIVMDSNKVNTIAKVYSVDESGNETEACPNSVNSIFTLSEEEGAQRFYFDPDVMMVMPYPDNNLVFENVPGLLFNKVDSDGNPVKGAEIQLLANGEAVNDPSIWTWNNSESYECLIDPAKLAPINEGDAEVVYTFHEQNYPNGYEPAGDIHFKKINNVTIEWWYDGQEDSKKTLDLTKERTIQMVDVKIVGAKVTLAKYDYDKANAETPEIKYLPGATFELYSAADDSLIFRWENFGASEDSDKVGRGSLFDNPDFKKVDHSSVKDGYLKPGSYYLTEPTLPEHPDSGEEYLNPGRIYFTVNQDYTITSGLSNTTHLGLSSNNGNQLYLTLGGVNLDGGSASIPNANKITFYFNRNYGWQLYNDAFAHDGGDNKIDGKSPQECMESADFNSQSVNKYVREFSPVNLTKVEIQNWGCNVYDELLYAEIETTNGSKYIYSKDASGNNATYSNVNEMLNVDGSTLEIGNKKMGNEIEVPVKKTWIGDEDYETMRQDVKVSLYRSTSEVDAENFNFDNGEPAKDKDGNPIPQITLNNSNNWSGKWQSVPVKSDSGDKYYYYVKEEEVDGYTPSYSKDSDGTLNVNNTLETISINAEKTWETKGQNVQIPASLVIKLQWQKDDGTWEDVPNGQKVLVAAHNHKYTYEGLPAGKTYRVVEPNVPSGWTGTITESNSTSENGAALQLKNTIILGQIQVEKGWKDETANNRPQKIYLKLYRSTDPPPVDMSDLELVASPTGPLWPKQEPDEVKEDYARLLQYSLYFYDGVMCGDQVNENSNYYWRGDCHTNDDVPGGFHDAGDHVMFGLPAGFSASTLGWSIYEYRDDVYDALNQTPHAKLITDHYADFFSQCIRTGADGKTEVLVQKGDGNIDHAYWGIPELQELTEEEQRTKYNHWRNDTGADIAAEYAAALAQSYVNFHNTGEAKYDTYLEKAIDLYNFSKAVNKPLNEWKVNKDETQMDAEYPGFYASDGCNDDQAWAACWLALAMKEKYGEDSDQYKNYKSEANQKAGSLDNAWGGYHWNNVHTGAMLVNAAYLGGSWDKVKSFVDGCNGDGYKDTNAWGQSRYNTGYQTIVLAAANHPESGVTAESAANWAKGQMNYILGGMNCGTCFVTGFAENSTKRPHFRAGAGQRFEMEKKDDPNIINGYDEDVFRLIGGLIGGPQYVTDNYSDTRTNYQQNEVASDYNANLIGAAAGLYNYFKTGQTVEIPGVKHQYVTAGSPTVESTYVNAQSGELEVNDILTFANRASVMAAEDNYIEFSPTVNQNDFNSMNKSQAQCHDISSFIGGKKITRIEVDFKSIDCCLSLNGAEFNWNGGTHSDCATYANGTITFTPKDSGDTKVYNRLSGWGRTPVKYDEISSFGYHNNDGIPSAIRFYYEPENTFTVTPSSSTLVSGDSLQLTASGHSGNITWTSDNASVAAVDESGKVTAVGSGTATITGTDADGKTGQCTITVESFGITEDRISIAEGGSGTLNANAAAEWSVSGNDKVHVIGNGKSADISVDEGASGTATITATYGGVSDTAEINITPARLTVDPVAVRVGQTAEIHFNLSGVVIDSSNTNASIATIDEFTVSGVSVGTTRFKASRNGVEIDGIINVLGALNITSESNGVMGMTKPINLKIENAVGNITWTSSDPEVAVVDENGKVTAKKFGEVTITATDSSDNTSAEYKIVVKQIAVQPDLPEEKEFVQMIELDSTGNWQKLIKDLPIANDKGKAYYYYIEEVDKDGKPVSSIKGGTSSIKYVPIGYSDNNGSKLDLSTPIVLKVENQAVENVTDGVELPSAGGSGTVPFYMFGGCLTVAAIIFITRRKVRKTK